MSSLVTVNQCTLWCGKMIVVRACITDLLYIIKIAFFHVGQKVFQARKFMTVYMRLIMNNRVYMT